MDKQELLGALTAIKQGDFSKRLEEAEGGFDAEIAATVNAIAQQSKAIMAEVDRISRELTDGMFGGQADVPGLAGGWEYTVRNFNHMAASLTCQVRDIAHVVTARASGDNEMQATCPCRGETLEIQKALNRMSSRPAEPANA